MMTKHAPARENDFLYPYVVTRLEFGRRTHNIKWATSLTDAKRRFGWSRERGVSISVRRATLEDVGPS